MAVREGLLGKSFELAAEAYSDATGGQMSKDKLRRVTEGWGQAMEDQRKAEAEQVYEAGSLRSASQVVRVHEPIQGMANISSDGGMVLVCEEGWKEVKMSVISEVKPKLTPNETCAEKRILLTRHSYQVGLWDADEMEQHQYLEGTRRQVALCQRLSSVNDGAPWIDRITTRNYPQAIQIIDWSHAEERLGKVSKAAFGEGSPASQQWVEKQTDLLWHGRVQEVVCALQALD